MNNGQWILAIKIYMKANNCTLHEARDAINEWKEE